ncbi:hypothetical protein ACTXKE_17705, partial [Brachybacterium alimentarium]|uniref:hypothetical protein n=1 Tax=Brachybacterium alimentarium TaxID=47845 RepID=UPI003FD28475
HEKSTGVRDLRRRNRLLEQENEVLRRAAAYVSQAIAPKKGRVDASVSSYPSPKLPKQGSTDIALEPPSDLAFRQSFFAPALNITASGGVVAIRVRTTTAGG